MGLSHSCRPPLNPDFDRRKVAETSHAPNSVFTHLIFFVISLTITLVACDLILIGKRRTTFIVHCHEHLCNETFRLAELFPLLKHKMLVQSNSMLLLTQLLRPPSSRNHESLWGHLGALSARRPVRNTSSERVKNCSRVSLQDLSCRIFYSYFNPKNSEDGTCDLDHYDLSSSLLERKLFQACGL